MLRRRRGDVRPDSPRDVLLVMRPDTAASAQVVRAVRAAAAGGTITVVLPLRIHGYAFGLPNPGLLPSARERATADTAITATVRELRRGGRDVDGEIVVTRHAHRAVADIARRRGARAVLVDQPTPGTVRRLLEGDLVRRIGRRLRGAATVSAIPS